MSEVRNVIDPDDEVNVRLREGLRVSQMLVVLYDGQDRLRHANDAFRGYLRSTDTIARIGGEEFLMILPGATMQAALALAQRLHHEPIRVHLDSFPVEFSYTFSAGVAQMSPGDSVQSLMARADQALYAAKARGRNTVQASET